MLGKVLVLILFSGVFSGQPFSKLQKKTNGHDLDNSVVTSSGRNMQCRGKEAELRFFSQLNQVWSTIWNVISSNVQTAANANNKFTFKLYRKLRTESRNVFYSPFSISAVFALVHASMKGKSKKEVADVFGFKGIDRFFDVSLGLYYQFLDAKSTNETYFRMANKIWIDKQLGVLKSFSVKLKRFYGGTISTLDFKRNAEKSRTVINRWVQTKTQQKINEVLKPGTISSVTDFVITNAIYFKGSWQKPFDPKKTFQGTFYKNKKDMTIVDMMRRTDSFSYSYDRLLHCQLVELPYSCGKFSMVIMLPDISSDIEKIEASLDNRRLKASIKSLYKRELTLIMPKFKLSSSYELVSPLQSLGMKQIFSRQADFSGLTGKRDGLFIQDVIHKAFIDVNEKGTESTAATALIRGRSLKPQLRINHPFLFIIRDKETNTILFLGRIVDPQADLSDK